MSRRARRLTINVEVIILATPKPWGIKSSHRFHSEELKFHNETNTLAIIPRAMDARVRV